MIVADIYPQHKCTLIDQINYTIIIIRIQKWVAHGHFIKVTLFNTLMLNIDDLACLLDGNCLVLILLFQYDQHVLNPIMFCLHTMIA